MIETMEYHGFVFETNPEEETDKSSWKEGSTVKISPFEDRWYHSDRTFPTKGCGKRSFHFDG
jgi:hypothetical protein